MSQILLYQELASIGGVRIFSNKLKASALFKSNNIKKTLPQKIIMRYNSQEQYAIKTTPEIESYTAMYPQVIRDIVKTLPKYNGSTRTKWLIQSLDYNVFNGSHRRYSVAHYAYKTILTDGLGKSLTAVNLQQIQYIGWLIDMCNMCLCMADDIMDQGQKRHDLPCWYRVQNVGSIAVNDLMLIERCIYILLKQQFHAERYYELLVEAFQESIMATVMGQALDMESSQLDLNEFTMDRYKTMCYNKCGFATVYLPIRVPMVMAGFVNEDLACLVRNILLELGLLFQMQDDYLDVFGNPKVIGKIGNDIQMRKCTWLSVKCWEHCTSKQKELMRDCYGHQQPEKVQEIVRLYESMHLREMYAEHRVKLLESVKRQISVVPKTIPHEIFDKIIGLFDFRKYSF